MERESLYVEQLTEFTRSIDMVEPVCKVAQWFGSREPAEVHAYSEYTRHIIINIAGV